MKMVSASLLVLGLFLCLAAVATAAGCNSQCSSNGDCTTPSCSHCSSGKCQSGLPCGAPCAINSDCYTLGTCPYCQAGICGSTPVYSASSTASPNPYSSASPSASPSAYPSPYPKYSASASASAYPTPYSSASRSPYPSPSPVVPSASPSPHPLYPPTAKLCVGIAPNDTYYHTYPCGPNVPTLVEGNWTAGECQKYASQQGFSDYALGCLGKTGVYVGTGHYPPGADCGWVSNKSPYVYKNQTKLCTLAYGSGSCSNMLATITAGDGWSPAECSYFVKVLQNLIPRSPYLGLQLGCAFNSASGGVYALGNKQGSVPALDCGWSDPPTLVPTLDNTVYNGTKFCGFIGGTSSDEINVVNVLNTWTTSNCYDYATENNSAKYFIGCIFFNSYSIGKVGGYFPAINCGW